MDGLLMLINSPQKSVPFSYLFNPIENPFPICHPPKFVWMPTWSIQEMHIASITISLWMQKNTRILRYV